jgi:enoyl-CoA hydratase/carnithine racemase
VVDAGYRKPLDLEVISPVDDFRQLPGGSIWTAIVPALVREIESHRTTLIFCNSRRLAERTADRLNEQRLFERTGQRPVDRRGGVAVVTLNRPPANAYDYEFLRELSDALDAVRADDDVRGLIINSALPGVFSAGADVRAFASGSQRRRLMTCLNAQEVFTKLERMPVPVVAAITATCLGGGLELALACDTRFAAEGDYRIGLPEVGVGLIPGSGGTQRLARLIGLPKALDLIVTGELVTPAAAHALGIVDRLLPGQAACLEAAWRWLEQRSAEQQDAESQ